MNMKEKTAYMLLLLSAISMILYMIIFKVITAHAQTQIEMEYIRLPSMPCIVGENADIIKSTMQARLAAKAGRAGDNNKYQDDPLYVLIYTDQDTGEWALYMDFAGQECLLMMGEEYLIRIE